MSKKINFMLTMLLVLLFAGTGFAEIKTQQPRYGNGTKDAPFKITSVAELYWLAEVVNGGKCSEYGGGNCSAELTTVLTVNSNLLGENNANVNAETGEYTGNAPANVWTPIGTKDNQYTGTFDGNGKIVRGLYFNDGTKDYVGLFGYISPGATVQNVGVVDSYFKGKQYVGGVVGYNNGGTISNAYNTGFVSGTQKVGGVVGYNNGGTISNAYNTGSVSGEYNVGGVVGDNSGPISNAYNTGSVSGNDYVGGVVGDNSGPISNAYNTGSVSGNGYVGGVVGYNVDGSVSNVYNTGSVSGTYDVGGVAGSSVNGTVSNAYNTGSVSGTGDYVGGVVGHNDGTIGNVYNAGSVSGTRDCVGGVVGYNYDGTISNVYNTGSVSGTGDYVGGVVGKKDNGDINKAYYDEQTCNNCNSYGTGKPLAELASLKIGSKADNDADFPLLEGEEESPWAKGIYYDKATGKLANSNLPYLKSLPKPQDVEMEFNVKDNVIQISSTDDLKNFAKLVNEYHITDVDAELTTNLTVNSNLLGENNANVNAKTGEYKGSAPANVWTPIGTKDNQYTGTFDGKGNTVSGLYFNDKSKDYVGLFGCISSGATVQNVGVIDSYIRGKNSVGGVVGTNNGTIGNVYNTGSVSGISYVGGVVGDNENGGKISNVYNTGSVSGTYGVGGVVGGMDGGDINKAYYDNQTCNNCNSYGTGKPLAELATLTIGSKADADFPLLEGEMESPWAKGIYYDKATGKLANSELPYLKSLPKPQDVEMEFNVKDNVIQISTAEDLKNFAKLVNEYHITDVDAELTTNLTVNSNLLGEGNKNVEDDGTFNWEAYRTAHNWNEPESWSPIGTGENPYQGTFNGNNKTVSGVFNSDASSDVGFFGRVGENGVVKNVGVVDSYINCNMYCGGIVGENDGSVSGVSYAGVVNGEEDVGGIIGKNNGGASVRNVYKTGAVYGSNLVGGIVGDNGASINNAFNMGTVSGSDNVGGVAGQNSGSVSKAYYNTDVTCENCAAVEGTTGKTAAELATINLAEAFPLQGSEMENPWANDISYDKATGKLTSTLPYLKNFPVVPDAETILSFTVASGVIQISTAEDLKNFAKLVNEYDIRDVDAELTTSITLNSNLLGENNANVYAETGEYKGSAPANVWTPIGTSVNAYTGTFDGNGHTIRGLYFNDENTNYVGLFGYIDESAKVQNVGVVDSYFKGHDAVGGVVGENHSGTISNVYNAGAVSGKFNYVGGVVGYNEGTVSNVYNTGSVSGSGIGVGGVVGGNDGTVSNAYNTGSVSGSGDDVGGVVGYSFNGTVSNVYNTGSVSGDGIGVGGVVGGNDGAVSNVYNTGSVSGYSEVGGVVGGNYSGDTVSNVYNTGSVSGDCFVGGVVGYSEGTVSNGFFNTEVTCKNCDVVEGTTDKSSGEFADGTVARLLHDWCEMDGETCKEGGLNGSIWGQDLAAENSLPDFSGVVGFKYGSITFFNLNDDVADSASIDATAKNPVSIPENIAVSEHVTFKRPFAVGYSTMMLPFGVSAENKPAELEFYSFDKVEENNGKYTASYNPVDAGSGLNAHTPYIVKNSGKDALSQVTFEGEFTLGTSVMPPPNSSSSAWEFKGTYEYKSWEEGDEGLGKTYGFAGSAGNDPKIVGQFAKVGAGAYIYPMRAYLEYTAPAPAGRPAANGVAANTVASLPDEIEVVIVDKDETTGEQTTRVIGKLDTRTGEFKFANDRWFDLNGRYLGNKKPTQKGAYYNNGKKVIVK